MISCVTFKTGLIPRSSTLLLCTTNLVPCTFRLSSSRMDPWNRQNQTYSTAATANLEHLQPPSCDLFICLLHRAERCTMDFHDRKLSPSSHYSHASEVLHGAGTHQTWSSSERVKWASVWIRFVFVSIDLYSLKTMPSLSRVSQTISSTNDVHAINIHKPWMPKQLAYLSIPCHQCLQIIRPAFFSCRKSFW